MKLDKLMKLEVGGSSSDAPGRSKEIDYARLQYMSPSQQERYRSKIQMGDDRPASPPPKEANEVVERFLLRGEGAPHIHQHQESEVTHLIDGVKYFKEIHNLIERTEKGDTAYFSGRFLDEKTNLLGDENPEHQIGNMLVKKAAEGVDVRIVLAGAGPLLTSINKGFFGKFAFRENYLAANNLRRQLKAGDAVESVPPLSGRVELSRLGSWTSSFHEKVTAFHFAKTNEFIATVGGIDPMPSRYNEAPHAAKELHAKEDPAWHDAAVLIKGGAAKDVLEDFEKFWKELTVRKDNVYTLKRVGNGWLTFGRLNPTPEALKNAPEQSDTTDLPAKNTFETGSSGDAISASGHKVFVQILSSKPRVRRPLGKSWKEFPKEGVREIYHGFTHAIENAKKYIYIEDQYLREQTGGEKAYEIYPSLVRAIRRGVKVILVGSGARDALDKELFPKGINRTVNSHIQEKVLDKLTPKQQNNVVVYRVEHAKVHAKVWAIDDKFATIGSANLFSRSHTTDQERTAAIATNGPWVNNFRSELWGEHLRLNAEDTLVLQNLEADDALGLWRQEWATDKTPNLRRGVVGGQDVLTFVGPEWRNDQES